MRPTSILLTVCLSVFLLASAGPAVAQQVTVSTPHTTVSDSFFEHTGTSWGARGNNWFFQFGPPGNPNGAAPPFGGFDPSAGANFGFGGGPFNGGFLGNFSQGSRRSFTSVTPSVTMMNGGTGMIMDTSVSPFVMGYIPVVGGFPMVAPPLVQPMVPAADYIPPGEGSGHTAVVQALQNASKEPPVPKPGVVDAHVPEQADDFTLIGPGAAATGSAAADAAGGRLTASQQSTAGRPAMSVAEAQRIRQAETAQVDSEAQRLLERGKHAQADGNLSVARTYFKMALNRASPSLRQEILGQIASLSTAEDVPR